MRQKLESPALGYAGTLREWVPFCILPPLSYAYTVLPRGISVDIHNTTVVAIVRLFTYRTEVHCVCCDLICYIIRL